MTVTTPEIGTTSVPTEPPTLQTATAVVIATVKPTLKAVNTLEPPDTPKVTPTGDSARAANREVTETLFLEYNPNETNFIYMQASPDGYVLAYQRHTNQGQFVVLDEGEFGPFDDVSVLFFSPDSNHLAFIATSGNEQFVVLDGVEQTHYPEILSCGCSWAKDIEFSPDGKRMAYVALKNQKPTVVIDGEEYSYEYIQGPIRFSPDSQRVAFVAGNLNGEIFVVVDGNEEAKYDVIDSYNLDLFFSPDSQHLAYLARKDNKWFVILDGEEGPPMSKSSRGIAFSPDSEHFAYDGEVGEKMVLIFDGVQMDEYDSAVYPQFSPDSQKLAYTASSNGDVFVVVGESEGPATDGYITNLTFSPDSERLAYEADLDETEVIVVDGEILEPHDVRGFPIFSPDSQHIAYSTYDGENWHLVLDGEEVEEYDSIGDISFSPDSNHLLFVATDDETWVEYVVMDGIQGKKYDTILTPILFDSELSFHYLAILGNEVYLIEERIN